MMRVMCSCGQRCAPLTTDSRVASTSIASILMRRTLTPVSSSPPLLLSPFSPFSPSPPLPPPVGGRNALTQDLIRDNLEDMDMDPYAPTNVTDDNAGSELYPQIAPPLSAALLGTEAAFCILKRALVTRRFKLYPPHTPDDSSSLGLEGSMPGGSSSSSSSSSSSNNNKRSYSQAGRAALLLRHIAESTALPGRYFPDELLVGSTGQHKRRVAGGRRGRGHRSGSAGGDMFGHLESRERQGGDDDLGAEGEGDVRGHVDGSDAMDGKEAAVMRDKNGVVIDPADYSEGEEEDDEYALDDDYGLAHGMSDGDDGGDDDDGDEAVF